MCRLCDDCTRVMFDMTCSIPNEDETLFEWKQQRTVLNDDGTCDYYKKITRKEKVIDFIQKPYYRTLRSIEAIRDFFKFSVIKRFKHGFDIRDTWSLNTSVSSYMVPRLRYFIDNKPMGTPSMLTDKKFIKDNDLSKYFSGKLQNEWFGENSDTEESYKAWIAILEAIYYSFEYHTDSFSDKFDMMDTNEFGERVLDRDKYDEINSKSIEGMRLFSIFIGNLWD